MSSPWPLNAVGSLSMEAERAYDSCPLIVFRPKLQYVNNDEPAGRLRAQPEVCVEWLALSSPLPRRRRLLLG